MTEKKKFGAIASWFERHAERDDASMPPLTTYNVPISEIGSPDLSAAYNFLDLRGVNRYVEYIVDFSIRKPILYFLWYKWWFAYSMPKEMRKCLPNWIKQRRQQIGGRFWFEFAKHNPTLFLLLLGLYSVFQFTVRRGEHSLTSVSCGCCRLLRRCLQ